jgi:hypothetical protein
VFSYLLEFTSAICETIDAIHRVAGQEQFQSGAGEPQGFRSSGIDHYPLSYRRSAGSNGVLYAFYLHKAETAGSKRFAPFSEGTKVGDVDVIIQSCPQDLLPWGSSYLLAVNR